MTVVGTRPEIIRLSRVLARLFEITIPSKTQAYMAVDGDAADLVRDSGGGVVAESENPQALADAAEALAALPPADLQAMGERAAAHYCERLALSVGAGRFGAIFERLAGKGLDKKPL